MLRQIYGRGRRLCQIASQTVVAATVDSDAYKRIETDIWVRVIGEDAATERAREDSTLGSANAKSEENSEENLQIQGMQCAKVQVLWNR